MSNLILYPFTFNNVLYKYFSVSIRNKTRELKDYYDENDECFRKGIIVIDFICEHYEIDFLKELLKIISKTSNKNKAGIVVDKLFWESLSEQQVGSIKESIRHKKVSIFVFDDLYYQDSFIVKSGHFYKIVESIKKGELFYYNLRDIGLPISVEKILFILEKNAYSMSSWGKIIKIESSENLSKRLYRLERSLRKFKSKKLKVTAEKGFYDEIVKLKYRGQLSQIEKIIKKRINESNRNWIYRKLRNIKLKRNKFIENHKLVTTLCLLLGVIIMPFFLTTSFYICLFITNKYSQKFTNKNIQISTSIKKINCFYSRTIPIGFYQRLCSFLTILSEAEEIKGDFAKLRNDNLSVIGKGEIEETDIADLSQRDSAALDGIIKKILFTRNSSDVLEKFESVLFNKVEYIDEYDTYKLALMGELSKELPQLLASKEQRRYLLVFSNNHQLKGVLGGIDIIGYIDVNKAKIVNHSEFIFDNLKQGNGSSKSDMRDINQNIDIDYVSESIESEIEKGYDITTDGVIYLNYDLIIDYIDSIRPENIILKRDELEKAMYNSNDLNLKREIVSQTIDDITKNNKHYSEFVELYFERLSKRKSFIFIKEKEIRKLFKKIGWGSVTTDVKDCLENCSSDLFALFKNSDDSIYGEISDEVELSLFIQNNIIKHNFTYKISNNSENDISYVANIYVPLGSSSSNIEMYKDGKKEIITPLVKSGDGHKLISFPVNISSRKNVIYKGDYEGFYKYDTQKKSTYYMNIFGQPYNINSVFSVDIKVEGINKPGSQNLNLTPEGGFYYNTTLDKNSSFFLTW